MWWRYRAINSTSAAQRDTLGENSVRVKKLNWRKKRESERWKMRETVNREEKDNTRNDEREERGEMRERKRDEREVCEEAIVSTSAALREIGLERSLRSLSCEMCV